jgi:hypothetical protein
MKTFSKVLLALFFMALFVFPLISYSNWDTAQKTVASLLWLVFCACGWTCTIMSFKSVREWCAEGRS